jgi:hypothetical protein
MWETISDLNVHVQVSKASVFFRRCTLRKILPKIGTGLILLAPSVYILFIYNIFVFNFCAWSSLVSIVGYIEIRTML